MDKIYNRKEVVDWVRGIYQNLDDADKRDALRFFPELAETEDERVREKCMAIISKWTDENDRRECLAYLEKQKMIADSLIASGITIRPDGSIERHTIGYLEKPTPLEEIIKEHDAKWLEEHNVPKQGLIYKGKDQKYPLCDSVKDKIQTYIANHFITDRVVKTDVKSIVKAMEEGIRLGKEEDKPVNKPSIVDQLRHHLATTPKEQLDAEWEALKEWGDVGPTVEEFLGWRRPSNNDWIEDYWEHHKVNNPDSYNKGEEIQFDHDGFVRFCKQLENPIKRSEEDEKTINSAIYWLNSKLDKNTVDVSTPGCPLSVKQTINRLKSFLRPWKPTDEQLEALKTAKKWYSDNMGCNPDLEELYEKLLKYKDDN